MTYPWASGEVLTAADLNAAFGLVLITSGSVTSASQILLDSRFSATYRNYLFLLDMQTSAGAGTISFQLRSGSTTIAANYNLQTLFVSGATVTSLAQTGQNSVRVGANDANGWNALKLEIFAPFIAQPTRTISTFNRDNGTDAEQSWGAHTASTSYDGMRISDSSGNMTGNYALFGYGI